MNRDDRRLNFGIRKYYAPYDRKLNCHCADAFGECSCIMQTNFSDSGMGLSRQTGIQRVTIVIPGPEARSKLKKIQTYMWSNN
jgi:hypothetical protein